MSSRFLDEKISRLEDHLIEHPDDNDTWLVLSDALQEKDDVSGTIIALEHLVEKTQANLLTLRKRIESDIPYYKEVVRNCHFNKGYITEVTLLVDRIDHLSDCLSHPKFRMLKNLSIFGRVAKQMDKVLEILKPFKIVSLFLNYTGLQDNDVQHIASFGVFEHLERLSLSDNYIGDDGAKALYDAIEVGHFPSLNDLYISGNKISPFYESILYTCSNLTCVVGWQQENKEYNDAIFDMDGLE